MKFPSKIGRPRNSVKTLILLELSQTSTRPHHLLDSLQTNYSSNFNLTRFENCTWQYFLSKGLPKNIFNWSMIELLKMATKEFMLSELEYVAVISLLQREQIHSLDIPLSMLLNSTCFLVKFEMENNKEVVSLLHHKLRGINPCFDRITEKILKFFTIQISQLSTIYSEFQKIMIQETNYGVKVGEIIRKCVPYKMKSKLEDKKEDSIMHDHDKLSGTSKRREIDGRDSAFWALKPLEEQRNKFRIPQTDKTIRASFSFFNECEFENGYYSLEEFESIS